MAKNKEPEVVVEDQVKALQQRVGQLELEKKQLESELAVLKADPFKTRQGYMELLEKQYEVLFQARGAVKRGGTGTIIENQMAVLKREIGEDRIAVLERGWRGM